MHEYLNSLKFTWTEPYNPGATGGFWSYSVIGYTGLFWDCVEAQRNPMWFTTWGIQQILDRWKQETTRVFPLPDNDFVSFDQQLGDHLLDRALRLEQRDDLDAYRGSLDDLVDHGINEVISSMYKLWFRNDRFFKNAGKEEELDTLISDVQHEMICAFS